MTGLRLFLSYARRDAALADRWVEALEALGHEVFRDTTEIPFGAPWREWLRSEIVRADAVVFLLTPAWLASIHCREELDIAQQDGKRLLPVAVDCQPEALPEALSAINLIAARPDEPLALAVERVDVAARTDTEWLQLHRRLWQEAKDWERQGRGALLLRRHDALRRLEEALRSRDQPAPPLNALQVEYLAASRQNAEIRRRWTWMLTTTVVAVIAVIGVVALLQWRQRAEQEAIATARRFLRAAEQAFEPTRSPHAALRLALAARRAKALPEVDDFLRRAMSVMPEVDRTLADWPGAKDDDAWWLPATLSSTGDGASAWAVFQDGRRHVRMLAMPRAASAPVAELPQSLGMGWVDASAPYGARITFQPETADADKLAGAGSEVQVLDLPALTSSGSFSLPGRGPTRTALDAEGRHVALAREGLVEVWQVEPRQLVGRWPIPSDDGRPRGLSTLRLHPSGRWIAAAPNTWRSGRAPLWIVDVVSGRAYELATFEDLPRAVEFDRSGRVLAAADGRGSLRLFQFESGREAFVETRQIELQLDGIGAQSLALSPDGSQVAVLVRNVQVFDVRTGQRTALLDTAGSFLFSPDSLTLLATDDASKTAWAGRHGLFTRWQLTGASEYRRSRSALAGGGDGFEDFDFLPGSHDIVATRRGRIVQLDSGTGREVRGWPLARSVQVDALAADPTAGVVRVLTNRTHWAIGATSAVSLPPMPASAPAESMGRVAVGSDGRRAVVFTRQAMPPEVWLGSADLAQNRSLASITLPGREFGLLTPALGGDWLALPVSRRPDQGVMCDDLELRRLDDLARPVGRWTCVAGDDADRVSAIHVDGARSRLWLASDRRVEARSLPDLKVAVSWERPAENVDQMPERVVSSNDGRWVALFDRSNRVIVSDAGGRELARLPVGRDAIRSDIALRFSGDGERLGLHLGPLRGQDTLWVWDWSPDRLVKDACARLAHTEAATEMTPALATIQGDPCRGAK